MSSDFLTTLAKADELAYQFLASWKPTNLNDAEEGNDDAVIGCYMQAFDLTKLGTKERRDVVFHLSDYYFKKSLPLIKIIKSYNLPITSKEVKKITDEIVYALDGFMSDERNKAAYIRKKEELITVFKQELTKNGIEVKSCGCYVATAVYGSYDCPQVWVLRRYRDNALSTTLLGRVFIRTYYTVSPTFVKLFGNTAWFNFFWRRMLDKFVKKLHDNGYNDEPYSDVM